MAIPNMAFLLMNFTHVPISPNPQICIRYIRLTFSLETQCSHVQTHMCYKVFLHHLGTGSCWPKQLLGPELTGV